MPTVSMSSMSLPAGIVLSKKGFKNRFLIQYLTVFIGRGGLTIFNLQNVSLSEAYSGGATGAKPPWTSEID